MSNHTGQIQHDIFTVDYTYRKTAGLRSMDYDTQNDPDDEDVEIHKVIMTDSNGNPAEVHFKELLIEDRTAIHDACIMEGREYAD